MKRFCLVLISVLCCTVFTGCGSETTAAGGGILAGFSLDNTLKGMQEDVERREKRLIAKYNEMVEAGARAEDLEDLKDKIADTVWLRQGTETTESVAKTDWTDPKAAGGAIGAIASLGYAYIKRRDLINTVAGVKSFRAQQPEDVKHKLDQALLDKRAAT